MALFQPSAVLLWNIRGADFLKTAYSVIFVQFFITSVCKRWFYSLAGTSGGRILGKQIDISTSAVTRVSWGNGLSRLGCFFMVTHSREI